MKSLAETLGCLAIGFVAVVFGAIAAAGIIALLVLNAPPPVTTKPKPAPLVKPVPVPVPVPEPKPEPKRPQPRPPHRP